MNQRKAGRPRVNLEGDGHGNPTLRIRLPQETMARVKAAGGSAWARSVIEAALAEHFVTQMIDHRPLTNQEREWAMQFLLDPKAVVK